MREKHFWNHYCMHQHASKYWLTRDQLDTSLQRLCQLTEYHQKHSLTQRFANQPTYHKLQGERHSCGQSARHAPGFHRYTTNCNKHTEIRTDNICITWNLQQQPPLFNRFQKTRWCGVYYRELRTYYPRRYASGWGALFQTQTIRSVYSFRADVSAWPCTIVVNSSLETSKLPFCLLQYTGSALIMQMIVT